MIYSMCVVWLNQVIRSNQVIQFEGLYLNLNVFSIYFLLHFPDVQFSCHFNLQFKYTVTSVVKHASQVSIMIKNFISCDLLLFFFLIITL